MNVFNLGITGQTRTAQARELVKIQQDYGALQIGGRTSEGRNRVDSSPQGLLASNCLGLNNRIPVRYSGVTYNANLATVVTHYSAETLRAAVLTALNSVLPALGWTVSLDLVFPGSLSIFANSAFALWWASSPSSIANEHLGFYSGFDVSSSGNRIDSPFQIANAFYPSVAVANDTRDTKERTADRITVAMSGRRRGSSRPSS